MPDAFPSDAVPSAAALTTKLSHLGRPHDAARRYVNPAVYRGSTILYADCAERMAAWGDNLEQRLVYGTLGGPTHYALEDVVAEIEGGTRCQIVSSGLAAVTTPLLAYLGHGDHLLMPDSVYSPTRAFCDGMLRRLGVNTEYYDPCVTPDGLRALLRPETKVLYLESPGSHSFEVQDVPGLAAVAHAHGAKVLLDNTWGIHFFQPFRHGVDVSIQALTKYVAGHSDLLLGGIITADEADWVRVRRAAIELGQYASPDDVFLALRGSRTLMVRLLRQMESGLSVARWFADRPEVARVLHPALPSCPGHALWQRDFTGASSLFGVEFQPHFTEAAVFTMVDSLRLFGIGASWGGYESLALPSKGITRSIDSGGGPDRAPGGVMVRFHVGLEEPADLIADLAHAMAAMSRQGPQPGSTE